MSTTGTIWERLSRHRRSAAGHPLAILVWGPSDDGSPEYAARRLLRDKLLANGHDARFSEELVAHPEALADPLDDETLQADAADLVMMFYGSRGTQSERDVILTNPKVASKAIVFVEESVLQTILAKSVSAESWKKMARLARIIPYKHADLVDSLLAQAIAITEDVRRACYVRDLRVGGLS